MDFSTENGMLRGSTFFPFFFHLSPNSHRSGRISNESYSAVFKYFDLQFPPSTNCEGAGRIPDASVLHCQVLGTKFSIRNLGPYLRCLLRFYLEDCHSDDSGVRARTRAGPRAEIYERPVLVRFWIFWTLVSTQQLQGRYLRDFCRQRRRRRDFSSIPYTTVCDRAPRTRRPVFRPSAFGCFWIFWPQIFMFQLLGCCLMVFCGENHMVRESCFWQKNFVQVLETHWSLIPSVLPLFGPPPVAPLLYEKSGTSQITISHSYAGFCCSFLRCWHNYPIVSSLCDFFVFSIVGFRAAASDVFRGYGREKFPDFTVQKYVRRKFCRNQLKFGKQVGYGVKHLFPGRTLLISSRFCFIDVCVVLI